MFLFIRFILAHLIGDFPLQVNAIYKAKIQGARGKLIHVIIIGILLSLFSWPFWGNWHLWYFILFVCTTHFFQDWAKIAITEKLKMPSSFYFFALDQIFHMLILSLIFLTPLSSLKVSIKNPTIFTQIYLNNHLFILAIGYLIVSFAGVFLIGTFKSTCLNKRYETAFMEPVQKYYSMTERVLMLSLLLYKIPFFIVSLPIFFIAKYLFTNREIKRLQAKEYAPYLLDTLLGAFLVGLTGIIIKIAST
ncbi:MAG: DUF3307 domain-containing protein [Chlamydiota bacterium]|nr:DUF3307 domain-containing protein [Chlamydiota bacterium]